MRHIARVLLLLALLSALSPLAADAGKGWCRTCSAPVTERNHTQYSSVWLSSVSSVQYFPDFYVSAGAQHGIQQTGVPDNKRCYHRLYHRATGQLIVGIWLWGNNYDYNHSYFTFGNNSSTSQAFRHSVTGCTGQVQVYYWH
jgi:hypothetical protein